ncbi:hypothetical protein PRZ48_005729 [Zasmidium cellare]|uniref:NmrA-like domain-containing protein n=1 Tax=Zasmidium cellare TaxID=395010 RepID=A0ABR0ELN5_ZASCE|nr:hypothetical protein PRZ48_005729 [Zasmidium cellare]
MVHTVGIVGVTGNVGKPTTKYLIQAASEGKIKLVIFHREGSKLDGIEASKNVEQRPINFEDPVEKLEEAVKGINVFISAVGFGALPREPKLVDALSRSADLVTYVPSVYSTTWNSKDFADPRTGPILKFLHGGWERAKEKGVGLTPIYAGVFDLYFFEVGTLDHLAHSLANIATSNPSSIANKSYSVVTFWPTGQELVDLYTKIHGKPTTIKPWTPEDREAFMNDAASFGPAKVGYWDKWESNGFEYEREGRVVVEGYEGPGLEEVARGFLH